jgi:putative flippase GtrA
MNKQFFSEQTGKEFLKYFVVGGVAFLVDAGLLYLLTEGGGLHYLLSAGLSFLAGLVTNYTLSSRFVFTVRTLSSRRKEFLIFSAVGLGGLILNELLLWLLVDHVHVYYMLAKVIVAGIVFLFNFVLRKILLFS